LFMTPWSLTFLRGARAEGAQVRRGGNLKCEGMHVRGRDARRDQLAAGRPDRGGAVRRKRQMVPGGRLVLSRLLAAACARAVGWCNKCWFRCWAGHLRGLPAPTPTLSPRTLRSTREVMKAVGQHSEQGTVHRIRWKAGSQRAAGPSNRLRWEAHPRTHSRASKGHEVLHEAAEHRAARPLQAHVRRRALWG